MEKVYRGVLKGLHVLQIKVFNLELKKESSYIKIRFFNLSFVMSTPSLILDLLVLCTISLPFFLSVYIKDTGNETQFHTQKRGFLIHYINHDQPTTYICFLRFNSVLRKPFFFLDIDYDVTWDGHKNFRFDMIK